jgi:hypothetical protein
MSANGISSKGVSSSGADTKVGPTTATMAWMAATTLEGGGWRRKERWILSERAVDEAIVDQMDDSRLIDWGWTRRQGID